MIRQKKLTTVVTSIAISEVEKESDHILSSCFNGAEKEELSKRHIRSTAGWLVLKKALCNLLKQLEIAQLSENDFFLKRAQTGRPYIEDINIQSVDRHKLTEKLFVSITHTRSTAYGMAVYEEIIQ